MDRSGILARHTVVEPKALLASAATWPRRALCSQRVYAPTNTVGPRSQSHRWALFLCASPLPEAASRPPLQILLVGLNARYRHTAFGLRCLQANLGTLEQASKLLEATINDRPVDILERILSEKPQIVGFGVYIWNVLEVLDVVRALRRVAPDIVIVLGL